MMSSRSITHPTPTGTSPWPRLVFAPACAVAVAVGVVLLQHVGAATPAHHLGSVAGLLAVVSLASTVAYLAILAVLHAVPTGYSPVRHAVSDYGVGRYRGLFTLALYVSSVGVLTLALALISGVGAPPLSARDLGFLLVIPLARIGMT